MALRFERLERRHRRDDFQSGSPELDDWFRTRASQDQRRRVAQVFVLVEDDTILGFYSLSMFTLGLESVPAELARKLPRYDELPAALIGRLARDERTRGRGIGDLLLADAIVRVLGAASSIAAFAIVVDAKDDSARHFYERHGFQSLPSSPNRLFLLTSTAAAAREKSLKVE